MCVGETLNMDSYSKFWGNLEGIWGNPGEIPHIGWKIPRVYRVKPCTHDATHSLAIDLRLDIARAWTKMLNILLVIL